MTYDLLILAIIKMVAAQRGVDVDKARGPVKLALKKMVASNQVKQLKVGFQMPFFHCKTTCDQPLVTKE